MEKKNIINPLRGMPDLLPEDTKVWNWIETVARETMSLYGFKEIRTPMLESKYLFVRGVGSGSTVVSKEMYDFVDKGGNEVALRPEGTAPVVRAFVSSNLVHEEKAAKLYYIGPMFRYERPQHGRQRQFYQIGVELLGFETPYADAEVITIAEHFLTSLGIEDWKLRINSLGCKKCRPDFENDFLKYAHSRKEDLCDNCIARMEKNPLRLLDCKNEKCRDKLKHSPSISKFLCESCREHFSLVKYILKEMGIGYEEDDKIVRGLDYYMRTAFEFTSKKLGAQDAILGGGRYDGLVHDLGGPEVPGVGWALGMERLVMLTKESSKIPDTDIIYFAVLGEKSLSKVMPVIQKLRKDGIRVEWDYATRSLKAQLRRAGKLNAHTVVILGDQELEKGCAIVKNMRDSSQHEVKIKDLPMHFVDLEV